MNENGEVLQISLSEIVPNQFQPRMNFDEKELQELAQSIKEHGIIQPLVLRKMGQKYEIIAGERRYRAAGMAGLSTVPAIISNIDDQTSAEVALVENVQRKDLSAIEEARSYKSLLDKGYLTQEQLAKKMGLSQPAIANKLRLLNLDESVQQALLNGQISERHARSLLALNSKEEQKKFLDRIINERLTVRQLDIEIKKVQGGSDNQIQNLNADVNSIKEKAVDIPSKSNSFNNNIFTNFNVPQASQNNESNDNQTVKMPNKFFNFLEDESTNMNVMGTEENIFNKIPDVMPLSENNQSPQTENKFIDFNQPPIVDTQDNVMAIDNSQKNEEIETLFDPMDQVEILDPDYETKKKQENDISIKNAISVIRNNVESLKSQGFNVTLEEIDLGNDYQIVINLKNSD